MLPTLEGETTFGGEQLAKTCGGTQNTKALEVLGLGVSGICPCFFLLRRYWRVVSSSGFGKIFAPCLQTLHKARRGTQSGKIPETPNPKTAETIFLVRQLLIGSFLAPIQVLSEVLISKPLIFVFSFLSQVLVEILPKPWDMLQRTAKWP